MNDFCTEHAKMSFPFPIFVYTYLTHLPQKENRVLQLYKHPGGFASPKCYSCMQALGSEGFAN